MESQNLEHLLAGLRNGERSAISRTLTLVESTHPGHRSAASKLLAQLPQPKGASLRLGVSGAPGVGKSTFIESLGSMLIKAGRRIAVLPVDPSSAESGGAILGDKTRMHELGRSPRAYVRPTASGITTGGIARRTRESMLVLEAGGFDTIIVETVGAGQLDVEAAKSVDVFLLMLAPGSGDELQGIKRGIVEAADLIVVNKCDGALQDAAQQVALSYASAVSTSRRPSSCWTVPVTCCSATVGTGVGAVWSSVQSFLQCQQSSGMFSERRRQQALDWLYTEVRLELEAVMRDEPSVRCRVRAFERQVTDGSLLPPDAAREIVNSVLGRVRASSTCEPDSV